MPQQQLSDALEQAERSDPVVRAAAWLRIARVLNAFDHTEAERLLERGIALAEGLEEPDREVILALAVSLAATVSPDRAVRLAPAVRCQMPGGVMTKAIFDMLRNSPLPRHDFHTVPTRSRRKPTSGPRTRSEEARRSSNPNRSSSANG